MLSEKKVVNFEKEISDKANKIYVTRRYDDGRLTTTSIKSCSFPYTLLGLTSQSGQTLAFLKVVFPCWYKIKLITLTITKLIHHKNQSILKQNMLALFID